MIEVLVFFEPFQGCVSLTCSDQSQVNGAEVLQSTLRRNELVSWLHDISVVVHDTKWEPSLLAFRVFGQGQVQILINLLQDSLIDFFVEEKSLEEDNLEVAVEFVCEILVMIWGRVATQFNVFVGKT